MTLSPVSSPMTMEERVAACARNLWEGARKKAGRVPWEELTAAEREMRVATVRLYGEALFPELFTVPPQGWIAPVKLTDEMREAAGKTPGIRAVNDQLAFAALHGGGDERIDSEPNAPLDQAFEAMTKAYLKEGK